MTRHLADSDTKVGWKARFVPKAWIRGNEVEVDPWGETDWELTDEEATQAAADLEQGSDLDYLRENDLAPEWVKQWRGPFDVELLGPDN